MSMRWLIIIPLLVLLSLTVINHYIPDLTKETIVVTVSTIVGAISGVIIAFCLDTWRRQQETTKYRLSNLLKTEFILFDELKRILQMYSNLKNDENNLKLGSSTELLPLPADTPDEIKRALSFNRNLGFESRLNIRIQKISFLIEKPYKKNLINDILITDSNFQKIVTIIEWRNKSFSNVCEIIHKDKPKTYIELDAKAHNDINDISSHMIELEKTFNDYFKLASETILQLDQTITAEFSLTETLEFKLRNNTKEFLPTDFQAWEKIEWERNN